MAGDKRNKRPFEEPSEQIYLNLKIKSQDGTFVYFRVNSNRQMKETFKEYCKRKQIIDYKTVRFFFNDQRLSSRKTANELGLENDDEIDAMLHQDGGGFAY